MNPNDIIEKALSQAREMQKSVAAAVDHASTNMKPMLEESLKNAKDLQDIAAQLPEDRLLVETDAPFLAPVPHRGRVCEPAYTADTARLVAQLRGVEPQALAETTTRNFFRLFGKASR